jgi:hypothetical protein
MSDSALTICCNLDHARWLEQEGECVVCLLNEAKSERDRLREENKRLKESMVLCSGSCRHTYAALATPPAKEEKP